MYLFFYLVSIIFYISSKFRYAPGIRQTVAELKVFVDARCLNAGRLDHASTDLFEKVAQALNVHMQRIAQNPTVVAYYAKFAAG
jgi:hypothetical protein